MGPTEESEAAPEPMWWLSYAHDDGFRGAVITRAPSFVEACAKARVNGWSPGGQVYTGPGPMEHPVALRRFASHVDRLLTKAEVDLLMAEPTPEELAMLTPEETAMLQEFT